MTTDQIRDWRYPGARWWKFDFHTHTPASDDYGKGSDQKNLRDIQPKDWLIGFMRAGIDCVAVTDHNTGDWIDRLKDELRQMKLEQCADFRPLYLFPGVEITANGGVHVLGLFDTDQGGDSITKVLGAVGYSGNPGASDVTANLATIGTVKAINERGGIPILAHVDGPSGAWKLPGNTLTPLFDLDELFAMEVISPDKEKPELYRQRKLAWAEVLGSDSHHPDGSNGFRFPGSHYSWVKMAQPSLEGLRLALLDGGGFSVRRSDAPKSFDPIALPKHFIEAIEIARARYMGRGTPALFKFSPWLNALVGGRGTGKSTVIHALRLVARRETELRNLEKHSEPCMTFERFNRVPSDRTQEGGLVSSTKVRWTLMRDMVRHRLHWRQDGNGTVVEEEAGSGNWKPSEIQEVTPERFPIRIFSQGQIAALAGEDQRALLQVIDDAAGISKLQASFKEARDRFLASRAQIRELDGKLGRRGSLVVERQDVERKLKRFEEAGHSKILTAYKRRDRQRTETERQFEASEAVARRIDELAATLRAEDLPDGLFDLASKEDRQALSIMTALAAGIHTAIQELRGVAERLRGNVEAHRKELSGSSWQTTIQRAMGDYKKLVETLESGGITNPNEYGRLMQDRQRLDSEMDGLKSLETERDQQHEQSKAQFQKVKEARQAVSDAREGFLSGTLAHNSFVRIQNRRYGEDPRVLERSLREVVQVPDDRFQDDILVMEDGGPQKGCVAELLKDLPEAPSKRCSEIESRIQNLKLQIYDACRGNGSFGGHLNNYLEREFKRRPEFMDNIWTWFPEDALSVEYSRRGDGADFQPITQASAGQRSAAMLAFLLAHGEEPLILDQPEDDLDNHLIYDLVVRQIRENKLRRQIIVVTHNPNIVVNGDAEMLHALDFQRGQCRVTQSGSLQEEDMREEVCRVMEGGREAFEYRYRRLGREPAHV